MPVEELSNILKKSVDSPVAIRRELIRRPSEDPSGDTREVAGYTCGCLTANGIAAKLPTHPSGKPPCGCRDRRRIPRETAVYNAHIDTYPVGDRSQWSYDPFGARIENGGMDGRGVRDMKGDIAATMPEPSLVRIARDLTENVYGEPVYENHRLRATGTYPRRPRGIPAVVYGPGHHNMASPDGYVVGDELVTVAEVHAVTALRYLLDTSQ